MRFSASSIVLAGFLLDFVATPALAGPFDAVTPCHDMVHLLDAGMDAYKALDKESRKGNKTFCQTPPGASGVQVCMTGPIVGFGDSEDVHYTVDYKIDGKVTQTWTVSGPELADPYSFTVESAELGSDGQLETVIGVVEAVSNGLAVEDWEIYIVSIDGKSLLGPIEVNDYGRLSGLYQVPGRTGCVLLASEWKEDKEPGRGYGTYAKGHWYIRQDDKMVEFSGLPPMERRLLYRFVNERDDPLWFKDSTVHVLKQ